jgi:hypothetical protein
MPNKFRLSDIGPRGLVIHDKERFFFVKEGDWRPNADARPLDESGDPVVGQLTHLNVAIARLAAGVFVDLDALDGLAESEVPARHDRLAGAPAPAAPVIYVREGDRVHVVPRSMWQALPAGAEQDAGVLVKRGAAIAAIPPNPIPIGTFCVLINLSVLREPVPAVVGVVPAAAKG